MSRLVWVISSVFCIQTYTKSIVRNFTRQKHTMLIDYMLIYMNFNILRSITNHLIYHQSRKHLGMKKRPIVLHTQFGFRDQMYYSFHMSQTTKCIFNGKLSQRRICTIALVLCQKAKIISSRFALNFISMMFLHILETPQESQQGLKCQSALVDFSVSLQIIISLSEYFTNVRGIEYKSLFLILSISGHTD